MYGFRGAGRIHRFWKSGARFAVRGIRRVTRAPRTAHFGQPISEPCMSPPLFLAGIVSLFATLPAASQVAPTAATPPALAAVPVTTPQYYSAYYAWQAGNYPDALQRFEKLLSGPQAAQVLEI